MILGRLRLPGRLLDRYLLAKTRELVTGVQAAMEYLARSAPTASALAQAA